MRARLPAPARGLAAAAVLLASAARHPAAAQDVVLTSAVAFVVTDSAGAPVPYAQVLDALTDRLRGVANARGELSAGRWALGVYQLVVRRVGYRAREFALDLREPDSVRVRVQLEPLPQQLATVATAATRSRLADFERRRSGPGVFYDRAEIERRRPALLTDLLRTTPGLTYSRDASGQMRLLGRDVSLKGGCPMEFVLDNVPIGDNSSADRMIDLVNVAAVEVYRGPTDVPAAYRGHHSRCGLVLVWTRIE
ncbi:MAG: TonB-dependent receptor plug domain-containing protein [Gemmatimonadaceae bacterium]